MLIIDGSTLEGGGQLVRSAVALSAITSIPVTIRNVRGRREPPGLRAQHVAAVRAVAAACGAETRGLAVGSRELVFEPGALARAGCVIDVGTAGSVPLVLQAWLPVALHCGGTIDVRGGTEVRQSPTIDYLSRLLVPLLRAHGGQISLDLVARGYYPEGGGRVKLSVEPSPIRPLRPETVGNGPGICSASANLPGHVAERQARSAKRHLEARIGSPVPAGCDRRGGPGTGSSVTAWAGWKGGSALGRRGWPAEEVGAAAAGELCRELDLPGVVDRHLADQLLIYLAQYGGSFSACECALHAETVAWLLGEFGLPIKITRGCPAEFSA